VGETAGVATAAAAAAAAAIFNKELPNVIHLSSAPASCLYTGSCYK